MAAGLAATLGVLPAHADRLPRDMLNGISRAAYESTLQETAKLSHRAHLPECPSLTARTPKFRGYVDPSIVLGPNYDRAKVGRAVLEQVTTSGCGMSQDQNIVVIESPIRKRGEGPAMRAILPGQTRADARLGGDVLKAAIPLAQSALPVAARCGQGFSGLIDSRVTATPPASGWTERWALLQCRHVVDIEIAYAVLPDGRIGFEARLTGPATPLAGLTR